MIFDAKDLSNINPMNEMSVEVPFVENEKKNKKPAFLEGFEDEEEEKEKENENEKEKEKDKDKDKDNNIEKYIKEEKNENEKEIQKNDKGDEIEVKEENKKHD